MPRPHALVEEESFASNVAQPGNNLCLPVLATRQRLLALLGILQRLA